MTDEAKISLSLTASVIIAVIGIIVGWHLSDNETRPLPPTPKFIAKDCFIGTVAVADPVKPPVDGIVEGQVDGMYYVLYYAEANRNSAGPKDGWKLPIADFDQAHDKVPCPASWETKVGKKP